MEDSTPGHNFHIYLIMNCDIIFWNACGATYEDFFSTLLDLVRRDKPHILVLDETKTHGGKTLAILENSYFDSVAISEANGYAGGTWTFWNASYSNIQIAAINDQTMVSLILKGRKVDWILTTIYASPNPV